MYHDLRGPCADMLDWKRIVYSYASMIQSGIAMPTPELTQCILQQWITPTDETVDFAYATQSCHTTLLQVYSRGFWRRSTPKPFGQSMDSLCHPCVTTTHLSYSVLSLKLPPQACTVLLVEILYRDLASTSCANLVQRHCMKIYRRDLDKRSFVEIFS